MVKNGDALRKILPSKVLQNNSHLVKYSPAEYLELNPFDPPASIPGVL